MDQTKGGILTSVSVRTYTGFDGKRGEWKAALIPLRTVCTVRSSEPLTLCRTLARCPKQRAALFLFLLQGLNSVAL